VVRRFIALTLCAIALRAGAADTLLQNDGFTAGGSAVFQGGFVSGEIGAVRLVPPGPFPMQLKKVQFLFGGASSTQIITLHVYQDSGGAAPGPQLYSGDFQVTGSDTAMQEIDLSAESILVNAAFRVGIQFQHDGYPSIARDDDGSINAASNFIYASGLGWYQSSVFGLTGDWIVRAIVGPVAATTYTVGGSVSGLNGSLVLQNNGGDDLNILADGPFTFSTALNDSDPYAVTVLSKPADQDCVVLNGSGTISSANVTDVQVICSGGGGGGPSVLQNDGFSPGANVGFQSGFVIGEIAAARFTPPAPAQLLSVRVLYGGAAATRSVTLRIWDDSGGSDAPGVELYSQDFQLIGNDTALQEMDVSAAGIPVAADFRVGIEFQDDGLPSVARDDDGNIQPNRNFVYAGGLGWVESSTLGLTGDWILRAVISGGGGGGSDEPQILAIQDVGNDQGRNVRINFAASAQDSPASLQPVLQYEAYRRIDPLPVASGKLAGWEFVGAIPSHGESEYNMIAPTLADSTVVDGMHWSVFFVRAATSSPFTFYDSQPDSGYSLDNLAPAMPSNFQLSGDLLSWDPANESDFAAWTVYGSTTPALDGGATPLGTTTDPSHGGRNADVGRAASARATQSLQSRDDDPFPRSAQRTGDLGALRFARPQGRQLAAFVMDGAG